VDLLGADGLSIAAEGIVLSEEKHAVTLLALAHRNTGAVPEGLGHLSLLVFVVTARAEGSSEFVLVTGESLEHHGRDPRVTAEIGAGALGIGLSELADHLEALGRGLRVASGRIGHGAEAEMQKAG